MKINAINFYKSYYGLEKPNAAQTFDLRFGSNDYRYSVPGVGVVKTHTRMFRDDLNWPEFVEMIYNHFTYANEVEIINQACSDGSEAYTIAILLLEKYGEEGAKKFFPIKARDINDNIIKTAQSGIINLNNDDFFEMRQSGIKPRKYFQPAERNFKFKHDKMRGTTYQVSDRLRECVVFEKADAMQDLENMTYNPNRVFLLRNVLQFVPDPDKLEKYINLLSDKLSSGNIFSLGKQGYIDIPYHLKERLEERNGGAVEIRQKNGWPQFAFIKN